MAMLPYGFMAMWRVIAGAGRGPIGVKISQPTDTPRPTFVFVVYWSVSDASSPRRTARGLA